MRFDQLDLENRVVIPTHRLYNQLGTELAARYAESKNYLIDLHTQTASAAQQLYQHPVDTSTAWYQQAVFSGQQLYQTFNQQLWPETVSQLGIWAVNTREWLLESQRVLQALADNYPRITADTVSHVRHNASMMLDLAMEKLRQLQSLLVDVTTALMDAPLVTLENYVMGVLNALLSAYFELISALLLTV